MMTHELRGLDLGQRPVRHLLRVDLRRATAGPVLRPAAARGAVLSSEPPRRRPCARRAFLRAGANDDDLEAISAATDARGGRRRRRASRRDRRDAIAATRPSLAANRTEPNRAEPTTPILSQAVLLEQSEGTSDSARLETAGRSARDRITRLLGALVLRMEVPKGAVGCLCRGVGRASARGGARGWSDVLGSAARGVGATHHRGAAER